MKNKINKNLKEIFYLVLVISLITLGFSYVSKSVDSTIGPNATVITLMNIGTVFPEILNVSVNSGQPITLNANSTKTVSCVAVIRDFNGDSDFINVSAVLFNASVLGSPQDNNDYYINDSCQIVTNFTNFSSYSDTNYTAIANCTFNLLYYANPGRWNCTVNVTDSSYLNVSGSGIGNVSELLAVGLPTSINYGTVNSTYVSEELIANVTNFGNVRLNLSIEGYAFNRFDNLSMNCSLGSIRNISIQHEKFNLSNSNPGTLTLAQTVDTYGNLSGVPVIKAYGLMPRLNDSYNEAFNQTFWRMYVPLGVAGTCSGNIVFGATKAAGA